MDFFKRCEGGCKRIVFIRKIREFKSKGVSTTVRSQSKMCKKCAIILQKKIPQ